MKEIIYTVGDSTGEFAKSLGLSSRDVAKTVGDRTVRIAKDIGLSSKDVAKTVGDRTVRLAKDIGPRRAIIGAAIVAAAVGSGIVLVRYLRRREQERREWESMEASEEAMGGNRRSRLSRAESRAVNAAMAHTR